MKNLLKRCYLNLTARFPGTVLGVALLLAAVSVSTALDLRYNPRMDNLLPEDLEIVREFNEVVDKTGGSGPLVVVLEGLGPFHAEEVIATLTQRLKQVPGVRLVDARLPKKYINDRQLYLASRKDLEKLEHLTREAIRYAKLKYQTFLFFGAELFNPEELQELAEDYKVFEEIDPFYKGEKKIHYYMFVYPQGTVTDTDFTETFVRSVKRTIRQSGVEKEVPGLNVRLTGSLMVRLEENRTIVRDLKRAAVLAALLATTIILIYTRSGFSIPLIIFPLLLSLTYTFALTRLIIGHVNIISGFLVAILMGLGVDYGIHLYIRFKQELLKSHPISEAVETVMTQVGRSGVIAMLTTISIFSLLIFSEFRGFSEFGMIAAMGILSAFLTYFFVFPALILVFDRIHWLRKPKPRLFHLKISNLYSTSPYVLTGLFLLVLAISLFLLPRVEFEYDFQKLRGHSPAADYETRTTEDFGFAFSPTVILTPKKENLFHIHRALDEIQNQNGEESTIGLHHSLNLFTRKEYESKKDVLDRIRTLFDTKKDLIRLGLGDLRFQKLDRLVHKDPFDETNIPEGLKKKFTAGDDYLLLVYSPADKNFFDVRNIYRLEEEIESVKKKLKGKDIHMAVLNENLLAAEVLDWVREKGPRALTLATGLVFLILILDLQSLTRAIKTFLPLITGLALTGALMAVFHVKLNFINFVMLPSIVGIMIDHCIYLGHHILDYSRTETVKSLQETGSAIILSALTTLAGYVSLNLASHAGIRSIASLVELGILTCTLCALFMLPALFDLRNHPLPVFQSAKRMK